MHHLGTLYNVEHEAVGKDSDEQGEQSGQQHKVEQENHVYGQVVEDRKEALVHQDVNPMNIDEADASEFNQMEKEPQMQDGNQPVTIMQPMRIQAQAQAHMDIHDNNHAITTTPGSPHILNTDLKQKEKIPKAPLPIRTTLFCSSEYQVRGQSKDPERDLLHDIISYYKQIGNVWPPYQMTDEFDSQLNNQTALPSSNSNPCSLPSQDQDAASTAPAAVLITNAAAFQDQHGPDAINVIRNAKLEKHQFKQSLQVAVKKGKADNKFMIPKKVANLPLKTFLPKLFQEVYFKNDGYENACEKNLWPEIRKALNILKSPTSSSWYLQMIYKEILLPYERERRSLEREIITRAFMSNVINKTSTAVSTSQKIDFASLAHNIDNDKDYLDIRKDITPYIPSQPLASSLVKELAVQAYTTAYRRVIDNKPEKFVGWLVNVRADSFTMDEPTRWAWGILIHYDKMDREHTILLDNDNVVKIHMDDIEIRLGYYAKDFKQKYDVKKLIQKKEPPPLVVKKRNELVADAFKNPPVVPIEVLARTKQGAHLSLSDITLDNRDKSGYPDWNQYFSDPLRDYNRPLYDSTFYITSWTEPGKRLRRSAGRNYRRDDPESSDYGPFDVAKNDRKGKNSNNNNNNGNNIYNDLIRCCCGWDKDIGPMVECISCKCWSHMYCLGIADSSLEEWNDLVRNDYSCFICAPSSAKPGSLAFDVANSILQTRNSPKWLDIRSKIRLSTRPKPYPRPGPSPSGADSPSYLSAGAGNGAGTGGGTGIGSGPGGAAGNGNASLKTGDDASTGRKRSSESDLSSDAPQSQKVKTSEKRGSGGSGGGGAASGPSRSGTFAEGAPASIGASGGGSGSVSKKFVRQSEEEKKFLSEWRKYRKKKGFNSEIPIFRGKPFDLYAVYIGVRDRGGVQGVIEGKQWPDIWKSMRNFYPEATDHSYQIRRHYLIYLDEYFRDKADEIFKDGIHKHEPVTGSS